MSELRKDYFLKRWTIISEKRSSRPIQFINDSKPNKSMCFFCPGKENTTPPEIGRISKGKNWDMRWFPNKFPAVEESGIGIKGYHEVIVETPDHKKQIYDLSAKKLANLFCIYEERILALEKKGMKYVSVFKNHGKSAGTSLEHSHSQIVGLSVVPETVKELSKVKNFSEIFKKESKSERLVWADKNVSVFTPYAPQYNYEAWVVPKRKISRFEKMDESLRLSMAEGLLKILKKLKKWGFDFNILFYYAPKGKDLQLHFRVCPRKNTYAGFELETGIIICSVSPESAAKHYR